eukprot:403365554
MYNLKLSEEALQSAMIYFEYFNGNLFQYLLNTGTSSQALSLDEIIDIGQIFSKVNVNLSQNLQNHLLKLIGLSNDQNIQNQANDTNTILEQFQEKQMIQLLQIVETEAFKQICKRLHGKIVSNLKSNVYPFQTCNNLLRIIQSNYQQRVSKKLNYIQEIEDATIERINVLLQNTKQLNALQYHEICNLMHLLANSTNLQNFHLYEKLQERANHLFENEDNKFVSQLFPVLKIIKAYQEVPNLISAQLFEKIVQKLENFVKNQDFNLDNMALTLLKLIEYQSETEVSMTSINPNQNYQSLLYLSMTGMIDGNIDDILNKYQAYYQEYRKINPFKSENDSQQFIMDELKIIYGDKFKFENEATIDDRELIYADIVEKNKKIIIDVMGQRHFLLGDSKNLVAKDIFSNKLQTLMGYQVLRLNFKEYLNVENGDKKSDYIRKNIVLK